MSTKPRAAAGHLRARSQVPLLLAPAIVFFLAAFLGPLLLLLVVSVTATNQYGAMLATTTMDQYGTVLGDPYFREALLNTPVFATEITVLCLILGYPAAYTLVRTERRWLRVLLYTVIVAPLLTSVVVRTYGWIVILAGNGLVNQTLGALGLPPVRILYTPVAVLVSVTHVLLPFMTLLLAAGLQGIDERLGRASAILGAGPVQTFLRVTLPLSLPGITAGCLLTFVLAMGAYVTPLLTGGAQTDLASIRIYTEVVKIFNYPVAAALSFVLLGMIVIGAVALLTIFQLVSRRVLGPSAG